jgi:energy-converting hydrogenase Eha subunit A
MKYLYLPDEEQEVFRARLQEAGVSDKEIALLFATTLEERLQRLVDLFSFDPTLLIGLLTFGVSTAIFAEKMGKQLVVGLPLVSGETYKSYSYKIRKIFVSTVFATAVDKLLKEVFVSAVIFGVKLNAHHKLTELDDKENGVITGLFSTENEDFITVYKLFGS